MTETLLTFLMMFMLCVIILATSVTLIMVTIYFTVGFIVRNFGNSVREEEFTKKK